MHWGAGAHPIVCSSSFAQFRLDSASCMILRSSVLTHLPGGDSPGSMGHALPSTHAMPCSASYALSRRQRPGRLQQARELAALVERRDAAQPTIVAAAEKFATCKNGRH